MKVSRERINSTYGPSYRVYDQTYGYAPWSGHSQEVVDSVGTYARCRDNSTRGFAKARANNDVVILNDCEILKTTRTFIPGRIEIPFQYGFGIVVSGDLSSYNSGLFTPKADPNKDVQPETAILIKAYAKVSKDAVMSGEALNDLDKTVGMLRRPFERAARLLFEIGQTRAKLGLKKTAVSLARATAGAWLEHRYGWGPIVKDIADICDIAQKKRLKCDRKRLVARAGTSFVFKNEGVWDPAYIIPGLLAGKGSYTKSAKVQCDAGVIYDVIGRDSSMDLALSLGITARDIPATVNEIIPFSFVYDWFVGVGDWLQAITPIPGVVFRGNWVTTVRYDILEQSGEVAYPPSQPPNPLQHYSGSFGSSSTETMTFLRLCNQELPNHPVPTVEALSTLHQVDAMALLISPLLGGLRGLRH